MIGITLVVISGGVAAAYGTWWLAVMVWAAAVLLVIVEVVDRWDARRYAATHPPPQRQRQVARYVQDHQIDATELRHPPARPRGEPRRGGAAHPSKRWGM
jgi:membrane protein implicated in regulation of membrane protease activity